MIIRRPLLEQDCNSAIKNGIYAGWGVDIINSPYEPFSSMWAMLVFTYTDVNEYGTTQLFSAYGPENTIHIRNAYWNGSV